MMEIWKDFVTIHGEMVLLKNYSCLNFAGIPFTQLALRQPFFTTGPIKNTTMMRQKPHLRKMMI
jgi:hypothetical protein